MCIFVSWCMFMHNFVCVLAFVPRLSASLPSVLAKIPAVSSAVQMEDRKESEPHLSLHSEALLRGQYWCRDEHAGGRNLRGWE